MISKPAKELALLLQTKVIVERANTEGSNKQNGDNIKQFNIISNNKNIFLLGYGPSVNDFNFELTQDQAFKALSEAVQNFGDRIKFHLLTLPVNAGIEHCAADINSNVVIRIIEYYEIRIDEVLTRYDILIEKVIKNA